MVTTFFFHSHLNADEQQFATNLLLWAVNVDFSQLTFIAIYRRLYCVTLDYGVQPTDAPIYLRVLNRLLDSHPSLYLPLEHPTQSSSACSKHPHQLITLVLAYSNIRSFSTSQCIASHRIASSDYNRTCTRVKKAIDMAHGSKRQHPVSRFSFSSRLTSHHACARACVPHGYLVEGGSRDQAGVCVCVCCIRDFAFAFAFA